MGAFNGVWKTTRWRKGVYGYTHRRTVQLSACMPIFVVDDDDDTYSFIVSYLLVSFEL